MRIRKVCTWREASNPLTAMYEAVFSFEFSRHSTLVVFVRMTGGGMPHNRKGVGRLCPCAYFSDSHFLSESYSVFELPGGLGFSFVFVFFFFFFFFLGGFFVGCVGGGGGGLPPPYLTLPTPTSGQN